MLLYERYQTKKVTRIQTATKKPMEPLPCSSMPQPAANPFGGYKCPMIVSRGGGCRGDPLLKASPLGPRSFSIQAVNSFRGSLVWILKPRIAHPAPPPGPEGAVAHATGTQPRYSVTNRYISGGRRQVPGAPPISTFDQAYSCVGIKAISHFMSPLTARHSD